MGQGEVELELVLELLTSTDLRDHSPIVATLEH
jgi:hypothetical protein